MIIDLPVNSWGQLHPMGKRRKKLKAWTSCWDPLVYKKI